MRLAALHSTLAAAGLEPDLERVADALWLAALDPVRESRGERGRVRVEDENREPGDEAPPEVRTGVDPDLPVPDQQAEDPGPPGDIAEERPSTPSDRFDVHLPPWGAAIPQAGTAGFPVRVPAAPALPDSLGLARALRPLRKLVPSYRAYTIEEAATADRVAETGLWLPVLEPSPERWMDLALVVDTGGSMVIWRSMTRELRQLLERLGAFRDVRVWGLDSDHPAPVLRGESPLSSTRSAAEIVDPSGRRLTLIVTDGVGAAWTGGEMNPLLHQWAANGPLAILQPLPQRMWDRGGLRTSLAQIRADRPGQPNALLGYRPRIRITADLDPLPPGDIVLPVLEIERDWLAGWARLVGGSAAGWMNCAVAVVPGTQPEQEGVVVPDPGGQQPDDADDADDAHEEDGESRVRRFRSIASPSAFRLASYLSVVDVSLPIIRLVQRTMLHGTAGGHLAEVFLGGLLCRATPEDVEIDADAVRYEFLPGVRDALYATLTRPEANRVKELVSQFLDDRFGQSWDSDAWAVDPAAGGGPPGLLDAESRSFGSLSGKLVGQPSQTEPADDQLDAEEQEQEKPAVRDELAIVAVDHAPLLAAASSPWYGRALHQPMLFVGLGGTGCQVGAMLERTLREALCGFDGTGLQDGEYGDLLPYELPGLTQFVYADLNESELARVRSQVVPSADHARAASMTQRFIPGLLPRHSTYPDLARSLRMSGGPTIRNWLPPSPGEPKVSRLMYGSGQLPTVARAALFDILRYSPEEIREPLSAAINHMLRAVSRFGRRDDLQTCSVFVAFSAAGGTGAGIFYDFLHLISSVFETVDVRVQIYPLILMPSAFGEDTGGGQPARFNAASGLIDLFRLIDEQNTVPAGRLGGGTSVSYPYLGALRLAPAVMQTAFLFSRMAGMTHEDLYRSMVSFILAMIGTAVGAEDESERGQERVFSSFADEFIHAGLERQVPALTGIGYRPVSTNLTASLTVPVDELAELIGDRILARAVTDFAEVPGVGENNAQYITELYTSCGLEELLVMSLEAIQEPAPARGIAAVTRALKAREVAMRERIADLPRYVRQRVSLLAHDFDYQRGVREALLQVDPFRLGRIVAGHALSYDAISRAGFVESLQDERVEPAMPGDLSSAEPPDVGPFTNRVSLRTFGWSDKEVRETIRKQNLWYLWRTKCVWSKAWNELVAVWDARASRLQSTVNKFADAFLQHALAQPSSYERRVADLYRSRTGVSYLLSEQDRLAELYDTILLRFTIHAGFELPPEATESQILTALLGSNGWRQAYDAAYDHPGEHWYDKAVLNMRSLLKQHVKLLLLDRGLYGDEPPLLPGLRDLLTSAAGKTQTLVADSDLHALRRALTGLLPAEYKPPGTGPLKISIAYPQAPKDVPVKLWLREHLTLPSEVGAQVDFRAVDHDSIVVVMLRTRMSMTDVPEVRRAIYQWSDALNRDEPRDFLKWRQRLGYQQTWLLTTAADRVQIMQRFLFAMWNGQVVLIGLRDSPLQVEVQVTREESVRLVLRPEPFGDVSPWTGLLRAYEEWVIADGDKLRQEVCALFMEMLPDGLVSGRPTRPSPLFTWFVEELCPAQIRVLETLNPAGSEENGNQVQDALDFWRDTVPAALAAPFRNLPTSRGDPLRVRNLRSLVGRDSGAEGDQPL